MSPSEQSQLDKRAKDSERSLLNNNRLELAAKERDGYTSLSREEQKISMERLRLTEDNRKIIREISGWNPGKTHKGGFLFGSVGTGKSTLCMAIINKWASNTYRARFIGSGKLIERLKKAIDEPNTSVDFQSDKFIRYDLLVIDDLGTEKTSEWAYQQLFSIFDERCRNKRQTFFTSNLTLKEIRARYGARIVDRLTAHCRVFIMAGPSFRQILNDNNSW